MSLREVSIRARIVMAEGVVEAEMAVVGVASGVVEATVGVEVAGVQEEVVGEVGDPWEVVEEEEEEEEEAAAAAAAAAAAGDP